MLNLIVAKRLKRTYITIGNKQIKELFEVKSDVAVIQRKKPVIEEMARQGIFLPQGHVKLELAFDIWGINEVLEQQKRMRKSEVS